MADEYTAYFNQYAVNRWAACVCAVIFTILLSLDAYKAFKRRAHWIPSEALVLSALIIQLLTFIDNLNLNVNSNDKDLKDEQLFILIVYPLDIDIKRIMICLFIGYLLPGVVSSGLRTVWGDIGALALTVIWHMGYEAYFMLKIKNEEQSWIDRGVPSGAPSHAPDINYSYLYWNEGFKKWVIFSYITFFTAFILLFVLLTCAVIAGKSIRKIMSEKVPLALSCCCCHGEKQECKNIKNHVLKCWIVARASQPDYIMARSVFSSFAGLLITACVVLLATKWICNPYLFQYMTIQEKIRLTLEFVFILLGWIVIIFRWFTAVLYFPRDVRCLFSFEDFWTRSIVDIKNDLDGHFRPRLSQKKGKLERTARKCIVVNLITTFRLHSFSLILIMGRWLQNLIVSFSKVCWCLSDIAFIKLRPFIMSPEKNALLCGENMSETDEFHKYEKALETIRMPEEKASSLWIANLSAFKKVENNMTKGFESSKVTCAELINLLKYKTEMVEDEIPTSINLMKYKTGMVEDEIPTSLEDERQCKEADKQSWKMRAISLIHFMIYFYDGTNSNVVSDAIQAYSQAWCFMDIVDNLDPEGELVSLAADKEFETLAIIWNDNKNVSNQSLEEKIKSPLKHHMEQLSKLESTPDQKGLKPECVDNLHDPKDWMEVAAHIGLYKIWKLLDLNVDSVVPINHLRCLLANIMAHCLGKGLDRALIENCGKWAKDGKENEIFDAAFIAGKAKGAVDDQISSHPHAIENEIFDAAFIAGKAKAVDDQISSHPHAIVEVEQVGEE